MINLPVGVEMLPLLFLAKSSNILASGDPGGKCKRAAFPITPLIHFNSRFQFKSTHIHIHVQSGETHILLFRDLYNKYARVVVVLTRALINTRRGCITMSRKTQSKSSIDFQSEFRLISIFN